MGGKCRPFLSAFQWYYVYLHTDALIYKDNIFIDLIHTGKAGSLCDNSIGSCVQNEEGVKWNFVSGFLVSSHR